MTPLLRLAVVAGGAVGTLVRWALAGLGEVAGIPTGTLAANLLGAFALGFLVERLGDEHAERWTPVTAGLLGASTTFATLVVEVTERWPADPVATGAYLAVSLIAGVGLALGARRLAAGAHT